MVIKLVGVGGGGENRSILLSPYEGSVGMLQCKILKMSIAK